MVCGFLASDQHRNPLITTLPRVLKIDMTQTGSDEWIESSLRFALRGLSEGLLGASTIMSKLSELMFVEAVRRYADTLPPEERSWLAGTRDPYVGRALALLHGRTDQRWTAEFLAAEVSLSRSAFCDRFTAVVGMPPKRYMISWRLHVAKDKLREGGKPIAQIAHEVGYEAEAASIAPSGANTACLRRLGAGRRSWRRISRDRAITRQVIARPWGDGQDRARSLKERASDRIQLQGDQPRPDTTAPQRRPPGASRARYARCGRITAACFASLPGQAGALARASHRVVSGFRRSPAAREPR